MPARFSRREVLMQIGPGGLAAAAAASFGQVQHAFAAQDERPWYFLTDTEARWLAAIADVFIPQDDFPSASQAGVVDYMDFQLATDYGNGHGLYLQGPFADGTPEQGYQLPLTPAQMVRAGIEAHLAEGPALFDLDAEDRALAVQALSERTAPVRDIPADTFFSELLSLTNEGYFADPIYLGNADYAGWRMVGFPGAHAYYLDRVNDFGRAYTKPPMGIAHQERGRSTPPRLIAERG